MLTRKLMKMIKPQEKDSCMNEAGESAAAFSITLRTSGRTSQRHRSACTRCFSLGSIIIWKIQCALHRGTQLSLTKPVSASYQSILKATRGALCSHWAHLLRKMQLPIEEVQKQLSDTQALRRPKIRQLKPLSSRQILQ